MKQKLCDVIFGKLSEEILYNHLRPGDRISELELCEKFNVSRTPVRQALQQLEKLGLVEIRDGVGTYVTLISEQDVCNAYQIRCMAEKLAAKKAIHSITDEELYEQKNTFLRIQSQLKKGGYGFSFEDMIAADWKLHDLIINNSGNPMLAKTIEPITLLLRRCQFLYISQYERATEDHLIIIECLINRDQAGLDSILEKHLQFRP